MLKGLTRRSALKNFRTVHCKSWFKDSSTPRPIFAEKQIVASQRCSELAAASSTFQSVVFTSRSYSKTHNPPQQYPDFFGNGAKDRSNDKTIAILNELETASKRHEYKKVIKIFNDYHAQNPEWMHYWPAQKITATILHVFLKTGSFETLLELYNEIKTKGFKHGEGIYVTLIRCCLAMDNFERALEYFQEMKRADLKIRNIRIYPELIKKCTEKAKIELAFDIFREMQHKELSQKTKKQVNDQEMLVSLLKAATCLKGKQSGSNNHSVMISENILEYLKTRQLVASTALGLALSSCLNAQPHFSIVLLKQDRFNDETLKSEILEKRETASRSDVEYYITCIQSQVTMGNELKKLENFIKDKGPFHLVIDGANVMLTGKSTVNRTQTKLWPENLFSLLENYHSKTSDENIALIIPSAIERRAKFSQSPFYQRLKDSFSMHLYVVDNLSDDIGVLLTALHSELHWLTTNETKSVKIVSNDTLREHISMLADQQWHFLDWIRSKQFTFSWNSSNEISLASPLGLSNDRLIHDWHIPLEDGRIMAVKRQNVARNKHVS